MAQRRLSVILDIDTGTGTARLSQAGRAMRDFGLDTKRSADNVRLMGRSFDSLHAGMQRPVQALRDYVLLLGNLRFALMNVRDLAVGWVAGLVKQAAELERLTILMKGFSKATTDVGKSEEAQRNLREIMNLANRTGFEMKTVTDAFVKFQSADLNPQVYSLRGLAQAVAKFGGDSDTMHRAAIAIQQMAGKGVISMEELRQQLGEAVPSALKTLSSSLGMTVQETVKAISKGQVLAKPALELMLRDMEITSAGAGERIANSMFGQVAQVKTAMLQLSQSFAGTNALETFESRLKSGEFANLTQAQIDKLREQASEYNGLFGTIKANLKELNETLRSQEAATFMENLGKAVGSVANSLAAGIKFVVAWRSEIGGLAIAAAKMWLAFKAVQVGTWFAQMAQQAVVSLRQMASGTRELTGISGAIANWGANLTHSIDSARTRSQALSVTLRDQAVVYRDQAAQGRLNIQSLKDQAVAYQRNIEILTKQRAEQLANLRTAQTLNASNIAMGRSTVQSELAVKEAQDAVNVTTRSLITNRRVLRETNAQLVVSEEQVATATAAAERATARATIAEEAHAAASTRMATAARLAGMAVSFVGEMVNLALGPIGLIALALWQAAEYFGIFSTKADQAADSARNLANAIGTLEDVKTISARLQEIRDRRAAATGFGGGVKNQVKSLLGLGPSISTLRKEAEEEKTLTAQLQKSRDGAYLNEGRRQAEALARDRQNYRDRINSNQEFQRRFQETQARALAGDKKAGEELAQLRDQQNARERNQLQSQIDRTNDAIKQAEKIADPTKRANTLGILQGRLGGLTQQMEVMGQQGAHSAELITEALSGKGNSTDKAAAAAARRVGNLQGAIAGLQGQLAGDKSTNLQRFMAALAGGAYAGKSDKEIGLLRQKAALQDAVIDARAARREEEQYANAIGRVTGRIAELNVEMTGAHGNLARFNAELAAGMHSNWSTDQIEKYRAALAKLDETQSAADADKAFDRMGKELTKASTAADELWKSYIDGTIDANKKTDELRGRFMSLIEGIQLSPEAMAQFNVKVDEAVNKLKEADAILNAHQLRKDTAKIRNSLITDERQRRLADLRLELAEERAIIDEQLNAIVGDDEEAVKKRLMIEQAYFDWRQAKEAEVAQENEHAVVKMARGWYNLGLNIQEAMGGALQSFTDQLADDSIRFDKFAEDIVRSLFKIILQATIAYGILSALGLTNGQSYGQFMRQGVADGFSFKAPTHHTGGVIGQSNSYKNVPAALFANAFKYHGGGVISKLGPKEVPMIGLEGERVLTEDEQKSLGATPNVTVNVINNSGTELEVEHGAPEFNGRDMILSVVVDAVQKQGRLRDAIAAASKGH